MNVAPMPIEQHPYNGLIRDTEVPKPERHYVAAIHLSPLLGILFALFPFSFLFPLVLWLIRKDQSGFVDDHGREAMNFIISLLLWHVILLITVIGVIFWPVLWILALVSFIRAAVAGSRGEYFRYPATFRLL